MIEFLFGGGLEAEDLGGLGIEAAHHVLDRAVLPGGVHRLEHEQQRVLILRVENLSEIEEAFAQEPQQFFGALVGRERRGVCGIELRQPQACSRPDPEPVDVEALHAFRSGR